MQTKTNYLHYIKITDKLWFRTSIVKKAPIYKVHADDHSAALNTSRLTNCKAGNTSVIYLLGKINLIRCAPMPIGSILQVLSTSHAWEVSNPGSISILILHTYQGCWYTEKNTMWYSAPERRTSKIQSHRRWPDATIPISNTLCL